VLCSDTAHVSGLLDFVFVHYLLDIHLEALARTKCVTILGEDYDKARVDPIIATTG